MVSKLPYELSLGQILHSVMSFASPNWNLLLFRAPTFPFLGISFHYTKHKFPLTVSKGFVDCLRDG